MQGKLMMTMRKDKVAHKRDSHYKKKDNLTSFLLASVMRNVAKFSTLCRLKHKRR